MAKTRKIQFRGCHETLDDGEYYTYLELSRTIGSTYNCIKNRLYSKKYCTVDDLYEPYSRSGGSIRKEPKDIKRLETDAQIMSDKFLRRKLTWEE